MDPELDEIAPYQYVQPTGFDALTDSLPHICRFLKIHDLRTVRKVCIQFRNAVDLELTRRGPQILELDIKKYDRFYHKEYYNLFRQKSLLRNLKETQEVEPSIAVFFTDTEEPFGIHESISCDLGSNYLSKLSNSCLGLVHVEGVAVTLDGKKLQAIDNDAVVILFPETPRVKVKATDFVLEEEDEFGERGNPDFPKIVVDRIFLEDTTSTNNPSALIVFNYEVSDDNSLWNVLLSKKKSVDMLNEIKKRFKSTPGHFSLWGTKTLDLHLFSMRNHNSTWCGITISGPGVQSWSIAVNMKDRPSAINEKLIAFKRIISFKTNTTVALAVQTSYEDESHEDRVAKTNAFTKIFPTLTLVNFCTEVGSPKYCIDTLTCLEEDPEMEFGDDYVCYLVLSYT